MSIRWYENIRRNYRMIFRFLKKSLLILLILSSVVKNYSTPNSSFERITTNDGLSQSTINCIIQDKTGFLWFGTYNGLNKYDGYSFKIFKNIPNDSTSLINNGIDFICEDSEGYIWVINSPRKGLCKYIPETEKFVRYLHNPIDTNSLSSNTVNHVFEDSKQNLWISTDKGIDLYSKNLIDGGREEKFIRFGDFGLEEQVKFIFENQEGEILLISNYVYKFDFVNRKVRKISNLLEPVGFSHRIQSAFEDSNGNIYLASRITGNIKLIYNKTKKTYSSDLNSKLNVSPEEGNVLVIDQQKNIWIGTRSHGLYKKTFVKNDLINFISNKYNLNSLSDNNIKSLFIDKFGILWIGTQSQGICKVNLNQKLFESYKSTSGKINSLTDNAIFGIHSSTPGVIWIGTDIGGVNKLIFDENQNEQIINYSFNPANISSLQANATLCLYQRKNKEVWIGRRGGIISVIYPLSSKVNITPKIEHYKENPWTFTLFEDKNETIWGGTWGSGLWKFDDETNIFQYYKHRPEDSSSLCSSSIWALFEDNEENLWIGGHSQGFSILTKNEKNKLNPTFINYPLKDQAEFLENNPINCFYQDSRGIIWLATGSGLGRLKSANSDSLDIHNLSFKLYQKIDGLPSEGISGILEDSHGNLWLSTSNGISKFNFETKEFRNYSKVDGLQSNEFWHNNYFKDSNGRMYFGGPNGVTAFYPNEIKDDTIKPEIIFIDLKLFNKSVAIGEEINGDIILNKSISETPEINISYNNNVLTFEYAALHLVHPEKNQYAYIMEGFDKQWHYVGNKREATYTNIDPGEYVFRVKASNHDGVWNEEGNAIKITIIPPFWKTWWFRVLLFIIIVGVVLLIYYLRIKSLRKQKEELELQVEYRTKELKSANEDLIKRQNIIEDQSEELQIQSEMLIHANKELQESNATKDRLFSIIAHDLKNPFTSILGFSEFLSEYGTEMPAEEIKEMTKEMNNASKTLYRLLENLLAWSMSQMGKIGLNPEYINLREMISNNLELIKSSMDLKGNKTIINISKELQCYADKNMINTVFRNILSNANKFCENGTFTINAEIKNRQVKISLRDTGIGITKEKVKSLFEIREAKSTRGTKGEQGTGLGLILCKEFIEKNDGEIFAESELKKGTTIFILLPANKMDVVT